MGGLLLLGIGGFYLVSATDLFRVKNIYIANAPEIDPKSLVEALRPQLAISFLGGLLGPDNYLAWDENLIYTGLNFSGITIKKNLLTRSIEITAIPRERFAIWCVTETEPSCYWLDETGQIFDLAPFPEGQLIPVIYEQNSTTSSPVTVGLAVTKLTTFENLKSILQFLRSEGISAEKIIFHRELQELQVQTFVGTELLFSVRFDPKISSLAAIKKLINEYDLAKFAYIDLTSENRVLVKLR